jgi:uncharacterized protein (DUF2141 family)
MYALLLSLILSLSPATTMESKQTLTIEFTGHEEAKGQILYKIVDSENRELKKEVIKVSALKQKVVVELPKGKYAVSAFHDLNSNNKLDKNLVGLPTEKYGFSNNARGTFGPPALSDQLISLSEARTISITLK